MPSTSNPRSSRPLHRGRRLLATLLLGVSACSPSIDPAEPPFRPIDYDTALAAAKSEGKLVFVDFFASWCPPCRRLESTTWRDPSVRAWLDANTIPLKVDAEANRELAWAFMVEAYPTLVLVDAEGDELGRMRGFLPPEAFLEAARSIAASAPERSRKRSEDGMLDAGGGGD